MSHPPTPAVPLLLDDDVSTADPALRAAMAGAGSAVGPALTAAGLLIRLAQPVVADLYCATQLASIGDRVFGELRRQVAADECAGWSGPSSPSSDQVQSADGESRAHGGCPRK